MYSLSRIRTLPCSSFSGDLVGVLHERAALLQPGEVQVVVLQRELDELPHRPVHVRRLAEEGERAVLDEQDLPEQGRLRS